MKGIDLLNLYLSPREIEKWLKNVNIEGTVLDYYLYKRKWRNITQMISVSFIWDHTPEGHDYWSNISERIHKVNDFNIIKTLPKFIL